MLRGSELMFVGGACKLTKPLQTPLRSLTTQLVVRAPGYSADLGRTAWRSWYITSPWSERYTISKVVALMAIVANPCTLEVP